MLFASFGTGFRVLILGRWNIRLSFGLDALGARLGDFDALRGPGSRPDQFQFLLHKPSQTVYRLRPFESPDQFSVVVKREQGEVIDLQVSAKIRIGKTVHRRKVKVVEFLEGVQRFGVRGLGRGY